MRSQSVRLIVSALIGALALFFAISLTYWALDQAGSPYLVLATALICAVATWCFMRWLNLQLDSLWRSDPNSIAGRILKEIMHETSIMMLCIFIVVGVLFVVARVLYLPPDRLEVPLQPALTFLLAALWLSFVMYALNTLMTPDASPDHLKKFSVRTIAASIALSLYFLIPFDWIASATYRAIAVFLGTRDPGYGSAGKIELNSTVAWLQSTAIPSIVSIGFGFLTAYVTSLVWYEFYRSVNGTGLEGVRAARGGRDPTRNSYWFSLLADAKYRVTLVGATLGGWFEKWEDFRPALKGLLGREEIERVLIVLPDPGGAFFWQRRDDEVKRERLLSDDPIARLALAIEMLFLALPATDNHSQIAEFLQQNDPGDRCEHLAAFLSGFLKHVSGHVATYDSIKANKDFSEELGKSIGGPKKKFKLVFARGSMMGLSLFDARLVYVPYLPGVEDKNCPEFTVAASTPLGESLVRSVEAMETSGTEVASREQVMAMAYRLWHACRLRGAPLQDLTSIPAWLLENYDAACPEIQQKREGAALREGFAPQGDVRTDEAQSTAPSGTSAAVPTKSTSRDVT